MTSRLEQLMERRHLVRCLIRGGIVVLVIAAIAPIFREIGLRIPYGWSQVVQRPIYSFRQELAFGAMCLACAVGLRLLEGRLVRWIVPIRRLECPQCGYRPVGLRKPRCPECGLALPREFVEEADREEGGRKEGGGGAAEGS